MEERRIRQLLAIFFILSLAMIAKVVYDALIGAQIFAFAFTERIPAKNGTVYDRNGRVLSTDLLRYVAYLDRDYLMLNSEDGEREILDLAKTLRLDPSYLREKRFPVLMRAPFESSILAAIPSNFIKFVSIGKEYERLSISTSSFSVYLKRVERYHWDILKKGKDGYLSHNLVSGERKISEPSNGKDIRLTVDMDMQKAADEILQEAIVEYGAKDGLIIIMESQTGGISAIASTYDWPFAAQGYFEPGSSIKPIIYAIAMEEGIVSTSTTFFCEGKIRPLEDASVVIHDIDAHGTVTTVDALVKSCNVASVEISKYMISRIGHERYYWWLRRFGFGEPSGIDVEKETSGNLLDFSRWYDTFFAHLAIGQGVGVNAFQLIRAFNAIATNGVLVTPHFLHSISGPDGEKEILYPSKRVISESTAIKLKRILEEVVERGTGVKASVAGLRIGGKTGTAQKASTNGYEDGRYYSIFLGFFPLESPQYTVLVLMDEPSTEYLGGEVAAPVFKSVVEKITEIGEKDTPEFVRNAVKGVVPDFRGLTVKEAQLLANALGLEVEIIGRGIVKRQDIEPGRIYSEKLKISLVCGFESE